jgi:putative NIF3 family GTP cyclohydrolase 1 type 2
MDAFQPLGDKLIRCIQNGISVISMHLNLDCAEGGIDDCLKAGIVKSSGGDHADTLATLNPLSTGGYGKVYDVAETTLGALVNAMQEEFSTQRILTYGQADKRITRVASFCGAGSDEQAVEFAVQHGADAIVSSDFKHHILTLANEKGIAVINMTHYASENYGFKKYYQKIRQLAGVPCLYHTDEELL